MTPEEYNQLYQLGTALAGDSFLYGVRLLRWTPTIGQFFAVS